MRRVTAKYRARIRDASFASGGRELPLAHMREEAQAGEAGERHRPGRGFGDSRGDQVAWWVNRPNQQFPCRGGRKITKDIISLHHGYKRSRLYGSGGGTRHVARHCKLFNES